LPEAIIVAAQLCSTRPASAWTRWCNCGETLSASAQRNATETNAATNTRPRFVGCANVLIALRACDLDASCARDISTNLWWLTFIATESQSADWSRRLNLT